MKKKKEVVVKKPTEIEQLKATIEIIERRLEKLEEAEKKRQEYAAIQLELLKKGAEKQKQLPFPNQPLYPRYPVRPQTSHFCDGCSQCRPPYDPNIVWC